MDRPFCLTCGRPMELIVVIATGHAAWLRAHGVEAPVRDVVYEGRRAA